MIVLIAKTEILKDTSALANGKPYSLSRTQLALWTVIIFCCFIYLWGKEDMIISDKLKLGRTALILLGISTATTALGRTIDGSDEKKLQAGNVQSLHQNNPTEGFLWDILSDKDGISIHRFQNVIFSIVLMAAFVIHVAEKSLMPEFDDTLLILSGVSSVGYLGVKLSENR
jgi:hypothetical protein